MRRNWEYWHVAGGFALVFGAVAIVEPYLVQHLLALGYTGTQVGTLMAVVNLVGIVFLPLASSAADRGGHQRRYLMVAGALYAASTLVMGLTPVPLVIGGAVISYRFFSGLGMNLRNRLSLYWLEQRHSQDYGGLRLWGSLGFSAAVFLGGVVAERTGIPFLFVISSGLMLLALVLIRPFARQLPTAPPRSRQGTLPPAMWMILLATGLMAFSRTAYQGWAQDFIDTGLGGGDSAVGAYMALIALLEVPVMFSAHRLIDRRGSNVLWVAGLVLLGGGFALLAVAQSVAGALVGALPIGLAQGMIIVAPVVLTGQVSKPHNVTLNLTLAGVTGSVGTMIGSPIAGALFDRLGPRPLFVIAALGMLLTAGVVAAGNGVIQRAARRASVAAK